MKCPGVNCGGISRSIIFSLVMAGGGCKDGLYAPTDADLTNPGIFPRVVSIYPNPNSVGPYDGKYDTIPPGAIKIWFNKSMIPRTVYAAIRFPEPEREYSVDTLQSRTEHKNSVFQLRFRDKAGNPLFGWAVGRIYKLAITGEATDSNGYHLADPFNCLFTPEPQFRVTYIPQFKRSVDQVDFPGYFLIRFNSLVDSSVLSHVSVSPPMGGAWHLSSGSSVSQGIEMTDALPKFGGTYTVTVSRGAHDIHNYYLQKESSTTFTISPFAVKGSQPQDGDEGVELFSRSIYIRFTGVIDTGSVRGSLVSIPPIDGRFRLDGTGPSNLVYQANSDLRQHSHYEISVNQQIRAADGTPLNQPYSFHFYTDYFRVLWSIPRDQQTDVSVYNPGYIGIAFSGTIDTTTLTKAITFVPPIPGSYFRNVLLLSPPSFAFFIPDSNLQYQTSYTVQVRTSLRSLSGDTLIFPYDFSFRTY